MDFMERWRELTSEEPTYDTAGLRSEVAEIHIGVLAAAHRAELHAGQTPFGPAEQILRSLAEQDRDLGRRLLKLLSDLGGPVPLGSTRTEEEPAVNHWARLCHDLEAHVANHQRLVDASAKAAEVAPQVADALAAVAEMEEAHVRTLRDLVAKADAQALD